MDSDKRNITDSVPDDLEELLNEAQKRTLRGINHFGWELHFVRRPLFQNPVPVLINREGNKFVILEENGSINETTEIDSRESMPAPELLKKMGG